MLGRMRWKYGKTAPALRPKGLLLCRL